MNINKLMKLMAIWENHYVGLPGLAAFVGFIFGISTGILELALGFAFIFGWVALGLVYLIESQRVTPPR